jgi:mRNA-degrading endonuclease RelE of RelBE toxin-antitoxin system
MGIRRLSVADWRIIYEVDEIDKIVLIRYVRLKTGPETYDNLATN